MSTRAPTDRQQADRQRPSGQLGLFGDGSPPKKTAEDSGSHEAPDQKHTLSSREVGEATAPFNVPEKGRRGARKLTFQRWRQRRAISELKTFLDHVPVGSADQYREAQSLMTRGDERVSSPAGHTESLMRRNEDTASDLADKKRQLRDRWNLPAWADLRA